MEIKKRPFQIALSVLLAVILIFSSYTKLIDMNDFILQVYKYNFLPAMLVPFLAYLLVLSELVVGVGLLIAEYQRIAAVASLMMTGFFLSVSFYLALTQKNLSCGCLGRLSASLDGVNHFLLLAVMLGCGLFVFVNGVSDEK